MAETTGVNIAAAIIPIKRFDSAKQRLAESLTPGHRAAIAAAMATDVLEAVAAAERVRTTFVISGEPAIRTAAAAAGAELVDDPGDEGHSEAAALGAALAAQRGFECAVMLPGDAPLLDPGELDEALAAAPPRSVGVAADRHGTGTNGLIMRPPDVISPSFGADSRRRHLRLAAEAGIHGYMAQIPSLAFDLDTGADLESLLELLAITDAGERTRDQLSSLLPHPKGNR